MDKFFSQPEKVKEDNDNLLYNLDYQRLVVELLKRNLIVAFDKIYPVGSIYINATNDTNPGTLLGVGTWEAFGEGKTIISLDSSDTDFDTAEETGGSKTHSHTEGNLTTLAEIAGGSQPHMVFRRASVPSWTADVQTSSTSVVASSQSGNTLGLDVVGTTSTSSNVPPYIVVYMWKRIA